MRLVVYGILPAGDAAERLPALPEGDPVFLVRDGGLAAAVSAAEPVAQPPSVASAPSGANSPAGGGWVAPNRHALVVQALHGVGTVLPMRYGISFESEATIRAFLRDRARPLRFAIEELRGREEMGVRILCRPVAFASAVSEPAAARSPARAYLASRRSYYAAEDGRRQDFSALVERAQAAFDGLFIRRKIDPVRAHRPMILSLHFLIGRSQAGSFRSAFRALERRIPEKLLLTGPWPPYNFASFERPDLPGPISPP